MPEIEREREERAPKLSSRFLHENINAEQRKVIVEYLIRLGVSRILQNSCHSQYLHNIDLLKLFVNSDRF